MALWQVLAALALLALSFGIVVAFYRRRIGLAAVALVVFAPGLGAGAYLQYRALGAERARLRMLFAQVVPGERQCGGEYACNRFLNYCGDPEDSCLLDVPESLGSGPFVPASKALSETDRAVQFVRAKYPGLGPLHELLAYPGFTSAVPGHPYKTSPELSRAKPRPYHPDDPVHGHFWMVFAEGRTPRSGTLLQVSTGSKEAPADAVIVTRDYVPEESRVVRYDNFDDEIAILNRSTWAGPTFIRNEHGGYDRHDWDSRVIWSRWTAQLQQVCPHPPLTAVPANWLRKLPEILPKVCAPAPA